jgi:hypothetical protein
MAVTNFSPLLGLALPTTGDLSGTWGTTVNDAITSLIDSAVAGTTTLSANSDVTLSTTNGSANQARNAVILWTASNGGTTRNITAPAQSKAYLVINSGTGSIVIRGAGPTTGVTVISGTRALVAWNGSDFVKVASNPVVLTTDVTGTLPVANGGTGVTSSTGTVAVVLSNSPTLVTPALGTPSALVGTNITGTATAFTASNVTTNANLTGMVTSVGNAASLGSFTSLQLLTALTDETGSGANVFATSPTLVTPLLGTPTSGVVTNLTGTASININGTVGATTANSGAFTTLTASTNLSSTRINPRVSSAASASTLTPDISSFDQFAFTALAAGLTINAPTGTPVDGNKLIFRFLDNGTTRTLTWNATYTVIGTTLPTATTANKMVYVGCIYNAANTRWDVIAVTTQV